MTVFRLEYSKLFGVKMDGLLHPVFPVTVHYQICPSALLSARNLTCNSLDVIFIKQEGRAESGLVAGVMDCCLCGLNAAVFGEMQTVM